MVSGGRVQKIGIIGALIAMAFTIPVIDQLPLPLLQWVQASIQKPELLGLISGRPHTYDGVTVSHIYPVPGRTDMVLITFPGSFLLHTDLYPPAEEPGISWPMAHSYQDWGRGVWVIVHQSRWDLLEEVEP
jgi:hypothetical protein